MTCFDKFGYTKSQEEDIYCFYFYEITQKKKTSIWLFNTVMMSTPVE